MYIHLGEKKIISHKQYVGIFNSETIRKSSLNIWIKESLEENVKSIAIGVNNDIIGSGVSPYTVIKRTTYHKDIIWSRDQ